MEWKFKKFTPNDTKNSPSHLEFFSRDELNDTVNVLVREDIQNRLDARRNNDPVIVRYFVSQDGVHQDTARTWFPNLYGHLNSPDVLDELRRDQFMHDRRVPFLVIEDFNTTGLRGNIRQTSDPDPLQPRNDFFWFVRNVGRSGKKKGDRGRWGLGKIVYPAASGIRAFFAYSVRSDDTSEALIGRAVLPFHKTRSGEFDGEGYFGDFPDPDFEYFCVPSQDAETIRKFCQDFSVLRTPDETGLSLVIPFPEESVSGASILKSVIKHYLWEILANRLIIFVTDGSKTHEVRRENLRDFANSWNGFSAAEKTETRRMVEFSAEADAMNLNSEDYFELKRRRPFNWNSPESRFASKEAFEDARRRFRDGNLLAFEVPVVVRTKKGDTSENEDSFMVYLQTDSTVRETSETFIRDGLTIIGQKSLKEPGVRALVVAEGSYIAELLGDAENPAHTRWDSKTKHFKGKYVSGPQLIIFVRNSAARLANVLARVENEQIEDLLKDVFNLPDETGGPGKKPGTKKGRDSPDPSDSPPAKPKYLTVSQIDGGFRVSRNAEATATPEFITIRSAYETISGSPYAAWHPADFDFSKQELPLNLTNCTIDAHEDNRLRIRVDGEDFRVEVSGFDRARDVVVDARAVIESPEEAEEAGSDD